MQTVLTWVSENWEILLAVVGGFALVAAATPNKSDDRIVQLILDLVNFLGANFGKSKNDPKVN